MPSHKLRISSNVIASSSLIFELNFVTPDSFNSVRKTLSISWDLIDGVDIYKVTIKESGKIYNNDGHQIYDNGYNSAITKEVINDNGYNYKHGQPGLTYSVTISSSNVVGITSSTFNMTT